MNVKDPCTIARLVAERPARHEALYNSLTQIRRSLTEDQLPLLITGATGVTGFNAFYYFQHRYPGRVFGQRPVDNWRFRDPQILAFNLEDRQSTAEVMKRYRFRSILSCGGNCALKSCELDPGMAEQLNVGGVESICRSCLPGVRIVHTSIDLVFSGAKGGGYVESDAVDPVTVYGKTMAAGEEVLRSEAPDATILRISLPMGISFNGHAGAVDWIQSRFSANRPATLYFDEVRTPAYVSDLNRLFEFFLANQIPGLYHAPGLRKISLYEIAQVINRIGDYDPEKLIGCYRIEAGPLPPRAGNVSMNGTRLTSLLGFEPLSPWPRQDAHFPHKRTWHFERNITNRQLGEEKRQDTIVIRNAPGRFPAAQPLTPAIEWGQRRRGNLSRVIQHLYS